MSHYFSAGFSAVYYESEPFNPVFKVIDVDPLKAKKKAEKYCRRLNKHLGCDACIVSNHEIDLPFRRDAKEVEQRQLDAEKYVDKLVAKHREAKAIATPVDISREIGKAMARSADALKTGKAAKKAATAKRSGAKPPRTKKAV